MALMNSGVGNDFVIRIEATQMKFDESLTFRLA